MCRLANPFAHWRKPASSGAWVRSSEPNPPRSPPCLYV
ncbi:CRISPR-associated protein Cas5 [Sphingomonas sp. RB3P16]